MEMGDERSRVEEVTTVTYGGGAFLAFALGGWVAVPILMVLASMGAPGYLGAWYGGLAGLPPAASSAAGWAPASR
jgi:hypothetical protein